MWKLPLHAISYIMTQVLEKVKECDSEEKQREYLNSNLAFRR